MRVRPKRSRITRPLHAARRLHLAPRRASAESSPPVPAPDRAPDTAAEPDDLAGERRARASGGPSDRAHYTCTCGFVFQAPVSTSVRCPNCNQSQAW